MKNMSTSMPQRDVTSWNPMTAENALDRFVEEALKTFKQFSQSTQTNDESLLPHKIIPMHELSIEWVIAWKLKELSPIKWKIKSMKINKRTRVSPGMSIVDAKI